MQLFYLPDINKESKSAEFSKEESKHIFKVLRKEVGDIISITNGKNLFFDAKITSISKNNCEVSIESFKVKDKLNYKLHIAISILKSNDRFEWFLEKASEIGISEITPIVCERSERKFLNENRLQKVLVSAMKQSLKSHLPKLNPVVTLKKFYKNDFKEELFIAPSLFTKTNTICNAPLLEQKGS